MNVSVVVPVYNMEDYLTECLHSLVGQTLGDLEVIVVDDGSSDRSAEIIDSFARKYPERIRAFAKRNGGLSDARNFGLAKCRGEYVGFVDADDFVDHQMFEQLYAAAAAQDADIATCPVTYVHQRECRCRYFSDEISFGQSIVDSPAILLAAGSYAWNKIYRRSLLDSRLFKFPVGQQFEDSAVVYNIMLDANRIASVNTPFYQYRRERSGSITNSPGPGIFDIFRSCGSVLAHYRSHPRYPKLQPFVVSLCVKHVMTRIKSLWNIEDRRLALSFASQALEFLKRDLPHWRNAEYFTSAEKSWVDRAALLLLMQPFMLRAFLAAPLSWRKFARQGFRRVTQLAKRLSRSMSSRTSFRPAGKFCLSTESLELIGTIGHALDNHGVVNFLDFGTLLGIVRNGKLLAHDQDIDIGVIGPDRRDVVREVMAAHGMRIWRSYVFDGRVVVESYTSNALKIDVAYYEMPNETGWSSTWLFYRKPGTKYHGNQRNVVEMRYRPIGLVVPMDVGPVSVNVPVRAEDLLLEKYGPDWRVPDPDWVYWQSPASINNDEVGHYIQFEHVTGRKWHPGRASK